MKIITSQQMQELDRRMTAEEGISEKELILRAGTAVARWIHERYSNEKPMIVILAGKGKNGADALVAAKQLQRWKYRVETIRAWKPTELNRARVYFRQARERILILDGLFGTGLNRTVLEPFFSFISWVQNSGIEVVALDIPSGLDANKGQPLGIAMRATHTLTIGLPKLGLVYDHAADWVGQLHVLNIGFPARLIQEIRTPYELLTENELALFFAPRRRNVCKKDFGHVLVIGGSIGMVGAPVLAAQAALRTGAGLVTLAVPQSICSEATMLAGPTVMTYPCADQGKGFFGRASLGRIHSLLGACTCVVFGMGIGADPTAAVVLEMLVHQEKLPMVLDAGALNLLSQKPTVLDGRGRSMILTPHPGEMGRLTGLKGEEIQKKRFEVAEMFARQHEVIVVLKGTRTILAYPKPVRLSGFDQAHAGLHLTEETYRFSVNALAGNPGMATAGSGDVLSGIIGAFLARGLNPVNASRAAIFLHARAGDIASNTHREFIATDIIKSLPAAQMRVWLKKRIFLKKNFYD